MTAGFLRGGVLLAVRWYRLLLRPVLAPSCRFAPSCSVFTEQAISHYGVLRGSALAAGRILRCHPWHPGGWDPVLPEER